MKIAIVTVPYITTDKHYNLAKRSYESFKSEHELLRVAVVNKVRNEEDLELIYRQNDITVKNRKNSLSSAWNKGIEIALNNKCDYCLLPNLDVEFKPDSIDNLLLFAEKHPNAGLWSMQAINSYTRFYISEAENRYEFVQNHDQSFSSFLIRPDLINDINFDEIFKPAYYEDVDFLRRLKLKGYSPLRTHSALFYHAVQGTVKNDEEELKDNYLDFLQRNRDRYIHKWGGDIGEEQYITPYNE